MAEQTESKTLMEMLDEIQEERLAKEEELASARAAEVEKGGTADVKKVTRQAVYGDTIEEKKRLEDIKDVAEIVTPFLDIPFLRPPGVGPEEIEKVKTGLEEDISQVEAEQEQKYQDILNLDSDELQSEYEKLANQYGWETTVDKDTGVKYFVPPPSFANNPVLVMGARAASETARGLASSLGILFNAAGVMDDELQKELENIVPKIEDESVAVTAGSEMISLVGGAASGYKIADVLLKNAPRVRKTLGTLLGTALGEGLVATEETGTISEGFGFADKPESALENKLRVAAESLGIGYGITTLGQGLSKIAQYSPVRALLDGVTTMFSGGKVPAEQAVTQSLVDAAVRARRAERQRPGSEESITGPITPEERLAAIEEMRAKLRTNFKAQTGKDFDDVVSGKVEMGEDEFNSTLSGLLDSDEFSAVERAILDADTKAGRIRSQEAAIEQQETTLGTREEAQAAGERAQAEIKASLEAEEETAKAGITVPLQRQVNEALDELDEIRKSDAALTPSGKRSNEATRLKANKFTKAATERVRKAFVDLRNAKNKAYDTYLTKAQKVEIPVDEVRNMILKAFGPQEIANIPKRLASKNPELRGTLQQILTQQRKLDEAVSAYKLANNIDAEKTLPKSVMNSLKKEVGYQDTVKLSNVETLREGVEFAASRGFKAGDTNLIESTDIMLPEINGLISKYVDNTQDLKQARTTANNLNVEFKDTFFPDAGEDVADLLRFGYKMTDNEMAAAATKFKSKLAGAVRGDADDIQYLQQIRNKMNPETQARLDAEIEEAMYNEVLNDLSRLDMTSQAAKKDPVGTVAKLNQRLETLLNSDAFALLPKTVVTRLEERFTPIFKRADNVADAQQALDDAAVELRKIESEIAEDPSYALVDRMRKSEPLTIVRSILTNKDAAVQMEALWQRAGTRGPTLESGLTQAQEDLRTIFAKGLIEEVKQPGEAVLKGNKLNRLVTENKAFNTFFPPESPVRQSMDMLIAQIKATDVFKGAGAKLSIEESVKDLSTFTEQLITYIKGPLTPEGRRLKILSRLYFRMAGGRDALESALLDTVTNPVIADRLLKEMQERITQQMISAEEAYKMSLGRYMLGRFGIASLNDLQRDVKQFVVEEETKEALPVSP